MFEAIEGHEDEFSNFLDIDLECTWDEFMEMDSELQEEFIDRFLSMRI